jgi:hypothetical protein
MIELVSTGRAKVPIQDWRTKVKADVRIIQCQLPNSGRIQKRAPSYPQEQPDDIKQIGRPVLRSSLSW